MLRVEKIMLYYLFIYLFIYYLFICTKIISSYRDPRGFAIKFYSDDGIWDLVGNNTPIFFISDAMLFPSFIHSQKRNPVTNIKVRIILELQLQNIHFLKQTPKELSYYSPFIMSETMIITTSAHIVKN